ncbi:MAG: thrombospondin type 3 repeat-containing protein [Deltaproteobacteria bacterium]|nr:thrombospondin type 3 repeat-containing protein [Deltaproteobacteria bacterium]
MILHQRFAGVSVFGAQIAVYLRDKMVTGLSGAWLSEAPLVVDPAIDEREASRIAVEAAGKGASMIGRPRLFYFSAPLRGEGGTSQGDSRLVWRVAAPAAGGGAYVMVDAMTGTVLSLESTMHTIDYLIQTANRSPDPALCGVPGLRSWFDENGQIPNAAPDAEGFRADSALRNTHGFFLQLGRNGWDGMDGLINLILDRGLAWTLIGSPNAAYSPVCNNIQFTDEMAYDDILAHEFSHGVSQFSARFARGSIFVSALQSDSLNEHYSDVFAAVLDANDWTIGEDSIGGIIRDMSDPSSASRSGFLFPDRMSQIDTTTSFPHLNSNIMNKAAFLIGQGGNFNGIAIAGIGRAKLGRLYFTTLTTRLVSTSNFQNAADNTLAVARGFVDGGLFGFTAADECSVGRALTAIELDGDFDCDRVPDSADDDADFDGVSDATDNCPSVKNPGQKNSDAATGDTLGDACDSDLDGDGFENEVDNCRFASNSDQADWNHDGFGDACTDVDQDRVVDSVDNCFFVSNPDQSDTDGDGVGDGCDVDSDNDGICYNAPQTIVGSYPPGWPSGGCSSQNDNCPMIANADQADTDGDSRGDLCDSCPNAPNEGLDTDGDGVDNACDADDDGDRLADGADNCPLVANADQLDFNGNGVGTACDASEQVYVDPKGGKYYYDGELRNFFDHYTIPMKCGDLVPSGFGGEEVLSVGFEASAPVGGAVVNRLGERLATFPPAHYGRMNIEISGDFCPVPSGKAGSILEESGSESYFLELYPIERTMGTVGVHIDTEVRRATLPLPEPSPSGLLVAGIGLLRWFARKRR